MTDNKTKTNMLASEMFGQQIAVQTNILALRPNPNIWLPRLRQIFKTEIGSETTTVVSGPV